MSGRRSAMSVERMIAQLNNKYGPKIALLRHEKGLPLEKIGEICGKASRQAVYTVLATYHSDSLYPKDAVDTEEAAKIAKVSILIFKKTAKRLGINPLYPVKYGKKWWKLEAVEKISQVANHCLVCEKELSKEDKKKVHGGLCIPCRQERRKKQLRDSFTSCYNRKRLRVAG